MTVPSDNADGWTVRSRVSFADLRNDLVFSDLNLHLNGVDIATHRFPLVAKSSLVRDALTADPSLASVHLDSAFPGSLETLNALLDFCYLQEISINNRNIVPIRCAAEAMGMHGDRNLASLADKCLREILMTARYAKDVVLCTELLVQCYNYESLANRAGVLSHCRSALMECWIKMGSIIHATRRTKEYHDFDDSLAILCSLPFDRVYELILMAKDKGVRSIIVALVVHRFTTVIFEEFLPPSVESSVHSGVGEALRSIADAPADASNEEGSPLSEEDREVAAVTEASPNRRASIDEEPCRDIDEVPTQDISQQHEEPSSTGLAPTDVTSEAESGIETPSPQLSPDSFEKSKTALELATTEVVASPERAAPPKQPEERSLHPLIQQIDALMQLSDDPSSLSLVVSIDWVVRGLSITRRYSGVSRPAFVRIASDTLAHFEARHLEQLASETIAEVFERATRTKSCIPHALCTNVDRHLLERAERNELDPENFVKMVNIIPPEYRINHDTIFRALELLLKSDRYVFSEPDRAALMGVIDFGRLSESMLLRAYECHLVPPAYITKAALSLCSRLRNELNTAKAVIQMQDRPVSSAYLSRANTSKYT